MERVRDALEDLNCGGAKVIPMPIERMKPANAKAPK